MAAGPSMDIREHGICVDEKKRRAKCNYCGKEVNSFYRLKCHLGGVGTDVTHCEHVTLDIKEAFRSMVMKGKPGLTAAKRLQMATRRNRGTSQESSSKSVSPENSNTSLEAFSGTSVVCPENGNKAVEIDDEQNFKARKCIARHFYENCIDFSVVDSPSFREMMTVSGGQRQLKIPSSHDLKGWMLQEAVREVQDHVKKVKDSWETSGCSILLDAWVDQKGHDLVSFIADSTAGAVYLKSVDVSDIKEDVTALVSLMDSLVAEVGVHNVVQIVACSTSGWVGELGRSFAGRSTNIFWSVSVSHCFELMLERIGKSNAFGDILDKVNKIPKFFNNNPSVLKLFKDLSHGINMTLLSSEFEFVTPYLLIESIFNAKNDLAAMFASSGWNKEEGITVSKVMNDSSFWESVERVVKCTSPLIHGLFMFSAVNSEHVGYIYDIMDGIKETIAKKLNHEELCYKPIWNVIDDVWNKHLHSPLHAAGYFLNPAAFYSTDFHLNLEVSTRLICSLVHIIKQKCLQVKVATQIDMYRLGKDCFGDACQADEISGFSPTEWWSQKASKHPQLQSFAIKVLSQTCEGASRYKLKRSLAEKLLLNEGMSHSEQQYLEELAFAHYNLHIQSCKAKISEEQ